MAASSSSFIPTPLAHADNQGEGVSQSNEKYISSRNFLGHGPTVPGSRSSVSLGPAAAVSQWSSYWFVAALSRVRAQDH
ncbi:hypothetical protein TNCV_2293411 [Trichonephila clavipes]|nr:hypothetical protein TNCV_2293411 [Trichonephila clavipes]